MLQKNLATDIAIISNILIDKLYNYNLSHPSSQPSCLAGCSCMNVQTCTILSTYPVFILNAFDTIGPCMFREIAKFHETQCHILIHYYLTQNIYGLQFVVAL